MKYLTPLLLLCVFSSTSVAEGWIDSLSSFFSTTTSKAPQTTPSATNTIQGLLPTLTENLGVTNQQASGGLGALLNLTKNNVSSNDFADLTQAIPDMNTLLNAAPTIDQQSQSGLNDLLGNAGSYGKALIGAKEVYQQFTALGLDATQIGKYIEITQSYLQSGGAQAAADVFNKGVNALLTQQ